MLLDREAVEAHDDGAAHRQASRSASSRPTATRAPAVFTTPHAEVETPTFMPVGTQGSVKGLTPDEVAATGARIVLGNTYHLWLRPGPEVVAGQGGLHGFTRWPHAMLTDSGGFQAFSLGAGSDGQGPAREARRGGLHVPLAPRRLEARSSRPRRRCACRGCSAPTSRCSSTSARRASRRAPWSRPPSRARRAGRARALAAPRPERQALFGIVQGACFPDLRRAHAEELAALEVDGGFDGLALGGFSVGEPIPRMYETLHEVAHHVDPERPRYLMGVGTPRDLLEAIDAGVDMFDCVLPTRNARNGQALTRFGRVVIKQARWREDKRPIDRECTCPCCRGGYSRAYLRHLYLAGEMTVLRLLSVHNLHWYGELVAGARAAIRAGTLGFLQGRHARAPRSRRMMREPTSVGFGAAPRNPSTLATTTMAEEKKQIGRILLKRKLISPRRARRSSSRTQQLGAGTACRSRRASRRAASSPRPTCCAPSPSSSASRASISNQIAIEIEHLDLVPREVAESSRILPVLVRDDRLFLAMANPQDKRVIDELEFVTGRRVYPYVAITSTLERTIRAAYDAKELGRAPLRRPDGTACSARTSRHGAERGRGRSVSRGHRRRCAARRAASRRVRRRSSSTSRSRASPPRPTSSTSDLEPLDEEVSKVDMLSDELRSAAGMGPAPAGGSGKKILVVDDEEDIRKLVRRLLIEKGHQVIEADRGLLALRLVKEETPDLILLDAMLPELHGFDIAKRIKGSDKYGSIPILMMSAVYRGWRIAEDLKANYGIEDYIEKPFRIAEILAKVARLLEREAGSVPAATDTEQISRNAAQVPRGRHRRIQGG